MVPRTTFSYNYPNSWTHLHLLFSKLLWEPTSPMLNVTMSLLRLDRNSFFCYILKKTDYPNDMKTLHLHNKRVDIACLWWWGIKIGDLPLLVV